MTQHPTQDSQSETRKYIKQCFIDNDMSEDGVTDYEDIELFDTDKVIDQLEAYVTTRVKEALEEAHRANGEHEFDNETDTYIDDMIEELEALTTTTNGKEAEL